MGWTFRDIDELDWDEMEAVTEHMKENPATHVLVAAYLGVRSEKPVQATPENLRELFGE